MDDNRIYQSLLANEITGFIEEKQAMGFKYKEEAGVMLAQLYTKKYKDANALILMATVTLDSEYLETDRKKPWLSKVLTTALRLAPWKLAGYILTGKVNTYYEGETEEEMKYGASFFRMIAEDRRNKEK